MIDAEELRRLLANANGTVSMSSQQRHVESNGRVLVDTLGDTSLDLAKYLLCNASEILALMEREAELRAERDALLQRPIDLAKMDSCDDEVAEKMISYYWCEQARIAREDKAMLRRHLEGVLHEADWMVEVTPANKSAKDAVKRRLTLARHALENCP